MNIIPYTAIGNCRFGEGRGELVVNLGKPEREKVNRSGKLELFYPRAIYRFDDQGMLVEASIDMPSIQLGKISVLFGGLVKYLVEQDTELFGRVGFMVSPKFGLAFDPQFPSWVTVFCAQELALWRVI